MAKGLTKYIRLWFPYACIEVLFHIYIFTITRVRNTVHYNEEFVIYRFVGSRFHSTALALKGQDIKYCGFEFYFVFFYNVQ